MYLKCVVDEAVAYIVEVFGTQVWECISKCYFYDYIPAETKPELCIDGKYHLPGGQCYTRSDYKRFNIHLNMAEFKECGFNHTLIVGTCVHEIVHAVINYYGVKPVIYSEVQLTSLDNFCGGNTYGSSSARAGKWAEAICDYLGYRKVNRGSLPLVPAFEGTINHIIYGMKHPVRR